MRWSSVIVALGSLATAISVTAPLPELPRSNSTLNLRHGIHGLARFGPPFLIGKHRRFSARMAPSLGTSKMGWLMVVDGRCCQREHGEKLWAVAAVGL